MIMKLCSVFSIEKNSKKEQCEMSWDEYDKCHEFQKASTSPDKYDKIDGNEEGFYDIDC